MSLNRKFLIAVCLTCFCLVGALAGCQPSTSGDASSQEKPAESSGASSGQSSDAPVASTTWSADSDCSICHLIEAASFPDSACLASTHAAQSLECMGCHSDESALAAAHKTMDAAKVPKKLKKTEVASDTCASCHNAAELKQATLDSTACTDANGLTVNPHDLPANSDHDSINCSDCHVMHKEETADESAKAECRSCHHADVYECHTCHA